MSDSDLCDRASVQINITLSEQWVRDNLLPAYEHCTSVTQAARAAVKDGVDYQEDRKAGLSQEVMLELFDTVNGQAGEIEQVQTLTLDSVADLDIDEADKIDVEEAEDLNVEGTDGIGRSDNDSH
jgi:hypothetical protein